MANHILNVIQVSSIEDFNKIKEYMTTDTSEFDFEQIVPMPKHIWGSSIVGSNERELFGENTLDKWRSEHWDVQWNAYKIRYDKGMLEINFNTPWRGVPKLMALLSQRLNVPIDYAYYEDGEDPDDNEPAGELVTEFYPSNTETCIYIKSLSKQEVPETCE